MGRITLDLLRKRAEHNNKELSTLEEVSLHQENLEKIELLDTACRQLQILYLQNNIIGKIENLQRLKELRYINLALNNIVRIEGLQGCECLEKVDLTVNFITDVTTVTSLRANRNLRELYLTGNPCTQFKGYREYVISVLPQLQLLDGKAVTRSERILALQDFERTQSSIRAAIAETGELPEVTTTGIDDDTWDRMARGEEVPELSDEAQKQFWEEETEHTPQARFMMQKKQEAFQRAEDMKRNPPPPKKERRFFRDDGTPLNINEGDWDFRLLGQEYDSQALELDFPCYRHLDTSQLEVDVQPYHVRVVVKGRVFQLHLPEEVKPDSSSAKRSMVTGHLLISMPKVKPVLTARARTARETAAPASTSSASASDALAPAVERLELEEEESSSRIRLDNIVDEAERAARNKKRSTPLIQTKADKPTGPRANDPDFVDDDDVPPLM